MENQEKKHRVGVPQIFGYGLGNFACQLSFTMMNMYLAYFYAEVFELSTMAVSALSRW